jgi:copper(I)-binding protein
MNTKAIFLATMLGMLSTRATAETYTLGSLRVTQPWARATPRGAAVAGAYLTITNMGPMPDRLTGGSFDGATRFELHRMEMDGNIATMRPVQGGIEIKPGQTVELTPAAVHVMLLGLKQPLIQGRSVKGTLVFEKAGRISVEFQIEPIGGNGPAPDQHSGH